MKNMGHMFCQISDREVFDWFARKN